MEFFSLAKWSIVHERLGTSELDEGNLRISVCDITLLTSAIITNVWRTLSDETLHPYNFLKVQHLLSEDFQRREKFCEWLLHHREIFFDSVYGQGAFHQPRLFQHPQ